MTRDEKIAWMAIWAAKNKLQLVLEGECGFGRECVGVSNGNKYVDYHWHAPETYERLDDNGDVWAPPDAYHKHDCVAVLGRGEYAESQLYDWLKWFDENNFKVEFVSRTLPSSQAGDISNMIDLIMHGLVDVRLVRQPKETAE